MTANPYRLIVWIDHRLAHLYSVTRESISEILTVRAPDEGRGHVHHKAGTAGSGHVAVSPAFLREVAAALGNAQAILIVGPADAKTALKKYIDLHAPMLAERIKGVEPMAHASKDYIHAFGMLFFHQHDLMDRAGD